MTDRFVNTPLTIDAVMMFVDPDAYDPVTQTYDRIGARPKNAMLAMLHMTGLVDSLQSEAPVNPEVGHTWVDTAGGAGRDWEFKTFTEAGNWQEDRRPWDERFIGINKALASLGTAVDGTLGGEDLNIALSPLVQGLTERELIENKDTGGGYAGLDEQVHLAEDQLAVSRGSQKRKLLQVLRDTPPSIADFGGNGDGSVSDVAAARACLDTYGICYLPFYRPGTYTPAIWNFDSRVVLNDGQKIIGDARQPKVRQGPDILFLIAGDHTSVENLLIDPAGQSVSDISQTTIVLDTASRSITNFTLSNIQWGMDRDRATLLPGYNFYSDLPHTTNKAIDVYIRDVTVWGAAGYPFYMQRHFAGIYIDRTVVEWTRQAFAPTVPGFTVIGGEGIFFRDDVVQGSGSLGTYDPNSHGFHCGGGAAIGFDRTRADGVGGKGYLFSGVNGLEATGIIGSFNHGTQIEIEDCLQTYLNSLVAGGRQAFAGADPDVHGIIIRRGSTLANAGLASRNNTGSGLLLEDSNAQVIASPILQGNGRYGIETMGSSNFNVLIGAALSNNTLSNGLMVNSGNYVAAAMPQSGNVYQSLVPTSGVAF